MTGIRKRSNNPRIDQDAMSNDDRARSYSNHGYQNLKTNEELKKRGVKANTPNLPSWDLTHEGAERMLKKGRALRKK